MRRASKISSGAKESLNVLSDMQFLLIPGMNFTCSGTITSLLLAVDIRTRMWNHLSMDLWRPDNNSFRFVPGSNRIIMLAAGEFSPNGVLQYNLTGEHLNFQNGDVLGVYQPWHSDSTVRLFYTTQLTSPVGYNISYHDYFKQWVNTSAHPFFTGYLLLRPITSEEFELLIITVQFLTVIITQAMILV